MFFWRIAAVAPVASAILHLCVATLVLDGAATAIVAALLCEDRVSLCADPDVNTPGIVAAGAEWLEHLEGTLTYSLADCRRGSPSVADMAQQNPDDRIQ